jgi:hypothetical protein
MRLPRIAIGLALVSLFADRAEAIPVQLHVFVELDIRAGYTDVLGLDGATLEVVYEIHDEDGFDGDGVREGVQGRSPYIIITGSAYSDGMHPGFPFWSLTYSSPTESSLGIHDFGAIVDGSFLYFAAGLYAFLPAGFSVPTGNQGGGLPFEFNNDHVTRWSAGPDGILAYGPIDPATGGRPFAGGYNYVNPRGYATAVGVPEPGTFLLLTLAVPLALRLRRRRIAH